MRRVDSFARSVVFAAAVAAAALPWMLIAGPVLGSWTARATYLMFAALAYLAGLAESPRSRWVAAAGLCCAVAAVAAHSATELAMALGVIVGVFRSGLLYRTDGPRAVLREMLFIGGGLLCARVLANTSLPPTAAGLWGFFLVQSFFFLGVVSPSPERASGDAFEAAYRRADSLLARPHS